VERPRGAGKIAELVWLLEDHTDEFIYTLHTLGWAVGDIGVTVAIATVSACVSVVARDPGSVLHASIHGWDAPVSREWMILANIYDSSEANRLGRKFKPMKRPWPDRGTEKLGRTNLPPAEAKALLKRNRG
jgi:hypothetical protein